MNQQSVENLQVTLACQVTQKNALISAVKLACVCYWAESAASSTEVCVTHWCQVTKHIYSSSALRFDT